MNEVFATAFSVFFIIGICTLLLSCNPHYRGQCIAYDLIDGTVYGYKFEKDTCSRCTSTDSKGRCTNTEYYDCYNSYLRYHYDNNQTCLFQTVSGDRSEEDAHNGALKYPIGYERQLIKRTTSCECISPNVGMDTWVTGVVFMSLCGAVLIAWVSLMLWLELRRYVIWRVRRKPKVQPVVEMPRIIEYEPPSDDKQSV